MTDERGCDERETSMTMNRTKRDMMRGTGAGDLWSFAANAAGLHSSVYCPSSITLSLAVGVLGNRPEAVEVGQISDQRQLHL
jgi:hypothetical protein